MALRTEKSSLLQFRHDRQHHTTPHHNLTLYSCIICIRRRESQQQHKPRLNNYDLDVQFRLLICLEIFCYFLHVRIFINHYYVCIIYMLSGTKLGGKMIVSPSVALSLSPSLVLLSSLFASLCLPLSFTAVFSRAVYLFDCETVGDPERVNLSINTFNLGVLFCFFIFIQSLCFSRFFMPYYNTILIYMMWKQSTPSKRNKSVRCIWNRMTFQVFDFNPINQ